LKVQRKTPKKLAGLIRGLSRKQLTRKPAPGKWSISEILAHLADTEIVIAWRLRHSLGNNGAPSRHTIRMSGHKITDYATPYEKLKALPQMADYLKTNDTECAKKMAGAKATLLRQVKTESPIPPQFH
jgi:hypothetical protein